MSPLLRIRILTLLAVLGLSQAQAFPPAPDGLVYGLVKDQYGTPLMNANCRVMLQTTGGVRIATSLQPGLAVGVNFAVKVPMDAGILPYLSTSNALTLGVPFRLYVIAQGSTNLPIEMTGNYLQTGTPSFKLRQDLTLGTDVNGSGIPDQWIQMYFAQIGTNIPLSQVNPNGIYTTSGRTLAQEYLLGNYPYDPTNTFSVSLVSQNAGQAVLAFTAIQGRNYAVAGSTDLQNWTTLAFTVPAAGTNTMTVYPAASTQPVQIQTVQPVNAPTMQFFRLQLQ